MSDQELKGLDEERKKQLREDAEIMLVKYQDQGIAPASAEGLVNYLFYGLHPGSFLTAVVENDLVHACGKADHANQKLLVTYAGILYNDFPMGAWGSKEKVGQWIDKGGLYGR